MRNLYDVAAVISIGSAGLAACQALDAPSQFPAHLVRDIHKP